MTQAIYVGDFELLKDYVANGVKLVKKPKGLVKKIDSERIVELKAELK